MIVIDASVLTNAFTDDGPLGALARAELARDAHWTGPEHLLVEVFSTIRGRWRGRKISEDRAADALTAITAAAIDLVGVRPLFERMWELRDTVTGYDAAYLALAESVDCTLLTADAVLARVPGQRCDVRLALPPSDQSDRL